ncbi:MAG: P-II family nitrogen regulator [Deltaproteobacteria bacterium]|nr:P-II family nitrogen regulator [Deltaproteobacteria bacterium]
MKQIKAFINPIRLDAVETALGQIAGIPGLSINKVHGYGRCKTGQKELSEKIELQIVVRDELVGTIVQCLQDAARTGFVGDGKIFISTIDDAIRIRTGQWGEAAL